MIFGINTTSDISKLLYVVSRAVRRVKFETILKYHEWYLCQISRTNHAITAVFVYRLYTATRKRFVIFTCRYFKLSWNIAALSQSNCRNFSCSSITLRINQIFGRNVSKIAVKFRSFSLGLIIVPLVFDLSVWHNGKSSTKFSPCCSFWKESGKYKLRPGRRYALRVVVRENRAKC